jgi:Ca2+-binding EF-hand superfamily protein
MAELSLGKVLQKMGVQLNNLDGQYERFQATMQRRRLMKKQYEEDLSKMADMMIDKLCGLVKKELPQKDPEQEKLYNTLKDTFNAFDKDGSLQLGYEEYVEAWKFLGRGSNETEIKTVWDSVDVDGSGLIEWSEFVFSLMGEPALQFGSLSQLETLHTVMNEAAEVLEGLQSSLEENASQNAARAENNAELRARLETMKYESGAKFSKIMNKMMGIMGQDPRDLLTDEQISKLLKETFKKFDKDGSGRLESPEFIKAWNFLGLKGGDDEIMKAFKSVDTDNSGLIDVVEFMDAVKGSRSSELSLTVLLSQMDGHLEGMEDFFNDYKRKLEQSKREAAERMKDNEDKFKAFQATARRRRIMKKNMEEKLANALRQLAKKVGDGTNKDDEEYDMYTTLKDTFNAFDRD